MVVDSTSRRVHDIIAPLLVFTAKKFLYGEERYEAGKPVEFITYDCYLLDHKGRVSTSFGFYQRIRDALKSKGYKVRIKDLTPHPNPQVLDPKWDRIFQDPDFALRFGQDEFLVQVMSNPCGRIDCPPGYGKTFLIGLIATLLPQARIDVVTKRLQVLSERIYPELAGMLPSVGIVCSKKKRRGKRVMCYSAGSVHHSDFKADIMIGDECHELAADSLAGKLARYDQSRNYGLSATQDMRLDKKDPRVEAIFGPLIYTMPYAEAEEHGIVVPITVKWRDVDMDFDPSEGTSDPIARKRYGLWQNAYRNELIAEDARRYDDDTQVLITVETIDHAMHLKRLLPEFRVIYSADQLDRKRRERYIKTGCIDEDEPHVTPEYLTKMQKLFEKDKIKKVICTTIWNVGVDFRKLQVLIRADGGGSPINDVQIPGRTSRTTDGKDSATVHDYKDQFNRGQRQKANGRCKIYDQQGWTQVNAPKIRRTNPRQRNWVEELDG
jgi:superfamily II DNA or RNA helicase